MSASSNLLCPICDYQTYLYDVVDFHKSCGDITGRRTGLSGTSIYYSQCSHCHFIFAPQCYVWTQQDFAQKIYNSEYGLFDPDFLQNRPLANAHLVEKMYGNQKRAIAHLDFGGGDGVLSQTLLAAGWDSKSYDPYFNKEALPNAGSIDLITAFEVFEHSPAINELCKNLCFLLKEKGVILFSTLLSDGNVSDQERLNWWYAAPRNGHISLFSKKSLEILAVKNGLEFMSYSENLHSFYR